ncbi:MAG TPA: family 16 glycosylhydrolase [Hymenobacter sp.]|jgi:beta-glucanase (GH16 family)|uniref:carbohydrate-binding protein n=1 Tax=Hymenobacter sp. TaxID=1898978 RepID=UPI002EDA3C4F
MNNLFTTLRRALAITAVCALGAQAQTYQQVWADEFTTGIGPSWKFETGGGGWGNNEKQYYQASNASVANGELRITARRENVGGMPYTSARMITQGLKQFTYGRMEARIKMPQGQGLWPAFWMLGSNISTVSWPRCGEIDIMEHINTENRVLGTVHWDNNGSYAQYGGNTATTPADYHVYSVEWTPTFIKWFVDGAQYHEINIANGAGGTDEFQRPFFLLLNLAVAGNLPGQTVDESRLPATMFVDYVRVFQKTGTTTPQPSSITLQAEAATVNSGMVVENCSEGGQNMGWIDAGDYLVWNNVNFPTSGTYLIEYRVASGAGGGTISSDLNAGSTQLGSTGIPGTGGWQSWTTVSRTVNVNAGTYNFGVYAQTGGYNLNWVRITKQGTARLAASPEMATSAPATSEVSLVKSTEIYPNPVADQLHVNSDLELATSEYRILNAYGKAVASGRFERGDVNVAALPAGVYTLVITSKGQQTVTRRFVK